MISEKVLRMLLIIILNDTSGEEYGDKDTVDAIMELARNTDFEKQGGRHSSQA